MSKLEQEIISVIAEEGEIEKSEKTPDSNLYDLGIDSLSSLEILVALEVKYDITIKQNRLRNVNSVREIIRVVSSELKKKQRETHVA
ncbi:acyl carrier protein [Chloroflexota bacterium]